MSSAVQTDVEDERETNGPETQVLCHQRPRNLLRWGSTNRAVSMLDNPQRETGSAKEGDDGNTEEEDHVVADSKLRIQRR